MARPKVSPQKQWRKINRRVKRQTVWASVRTLTRLAQEAQAEIQKDIPKKFDTTRKWWGKTSPTGIKIQAAKKSRLASKVFTGHLNTWLARHEYGKRRWPSMKKLVIPIYKGRGKSPDKRDPKFTGFKPETWRKAKGMSTALKKYEPRRNKGSKRSARRPYPVVFKVSDKKAVIRRKRGAKLQSVFKKRRMPTRPMKKRLGFRETCKEVVKKRYQLIFLAEMKKALAKR